ncbi:hypothetical protein [Sphaerisporangium sp. NPDC051011]|uniref:hypothetical protein n=1 Tax=Sphaerisporangium sp. NPDC051011 TaxID=3155792 RepID=UPI0033E9310E
MSLSDIVRTMAKNVRQTITNPGELKEKAKDLPLTVLQTALTGVGQALMISDRIRSGIKRLLTDDDEGAPRQAKAAPEPVEPVEPLFFPDEEEEVRKPARREPVIFAPRAAAPVEESANGSTPKAGPAVTPVPPAPPAPTMKPVSEAAAQPSTETAAKPVTDATAEAVAEPAAEPVSEAAKPTPEPAEPVAKAAERAAAVVAEPATEPVAAPVTEPAAEPVAETVAEAASEPATVEDAAVTPEAETVKPAPRARKPRATTAAKPAAKPRTRKPKADAGELADAATAGTPATPEAATATAAPISEAGTTSTLAEPLPGYSQLTMASLRARMRGKSADQIRELLEYERKTSARDEIVQMYAKRLAKLEAGE